MPTTYIPTLVYEKAHTEAIWDVAWSKRTNLIVTGGADDLVKCWDGTSGELKYTLEGHSLGVHSVDTNHDGSRALSSSLDSTICIWDLENNGALVTSIKPGALQSWRAKFSPDGKHCASGSHTGDLNVYSVENGEKVASYTSKTNFAMCVAYSPDGKYLAGGADDGSISVFDVETNQLIHSLPAHSMAVRDLTFAPDGRTLISGSDDRCINVYDVEHGQLASVLTATNDWVLSVAANPDISKQQLASGSGDNKIRIWDLSMRSLLEIHEDHTDEVWGVAWNPEGTKLVSASADTSIKWFASSGSS